MIFMKTVKDRKEFYSLLSAVILNNRDYFNRYGNWKLPQIKVFWLEVNSRFKFQLPPEMKYVENKLYELNYKEHRYWIDTRNERIWEIITFAPTNSTKSMINTLFLNGMGIDRLWFPERFMKTIQEKLGYNDRGFGIKFNDILTESNNPPKFSAKFWLGKNTTAGQLSFIENAKSSFSMSNIRFGKNSDDENESLSSELYELSYDGHITVTTSDDIENVFNVINTIEEQYNRNLIFLEKEALKKPVIVEVTYKEDVNISGFDAITTYGQKNLKLWLQQYERDGDLRRYSGVDLHTGDFIYLDMAEQYSYLSAEKKACMNVAPRFGTLSSRYLSSSSEIFYDGVELFA